MPPRNEDIAQFDATAGPPELDALQANPCAQLTRERATRDARIPSTPLPASAPPSISRGGGYHHERDESRPGRDRSPEGRGLVGIRRSQLDALELAAGRLDDGGERHDARADTKRDLVAGESERPERDVLRRRRPARRPAHGFGRRPTQARQTPSRSIGCPVEAEHGDAADALGAPGSARDPEHGVHRTASPDELLEAGRRSSIEDAHELSEVLAHDRVERNLKRRLLALSAGPELPGIPRQPVPARTRW